MADKDGTVSAADDGGAPAPSGRKPRPDAKAAAKKGGNKARPKSKSKPAAGTVKQLSNAASAGGAGAIFEMEVQASFVALMATGGYAPAMRTWPIVTVGLQTKFDGYHTDDCLVIVEKPGTGERRKLLCQIKRQVSIQKKDDTFAEVMTAAWADFRNATLFRPRIDAIALITGPLASTDGYTVHWLTTMAREFPMDDFFNRIDRERMGPANREEKLDVIRHHLTVANKGVRVGNAELHAFLRDFHILGFDFWSDRGVVLSLLHSHLAPEGGELPPGLWSEVVVLTGRKNSRGGYFHLDDLPEELERLRDQRRIVVQPATARPAAVSAPLAASESHTLALVALAGQWDLRSTADMAALAKLFGLSESDTLVRMQALEQAYPGSVTFNDEVWRVRDRAKAWKASAGVLTDVEMGRFWDVAATVLGEDDPGLALESDERMLAGIRGLTMGHSRTLRRGIAEGFALVRTFAGELKSCSPEARAGGDAVVHALLRKAHWKRWASLDDALPFLAEGSPAAFIDSVDDALLDGATAFRALFAEEGAGTSGRTYMTGLLWALETLAWDAQRLVEVVLQLAQLAGIDPGGNWANRPGNSLVTILLPWLPQTGADVDTRRVALEAMAREEPAVAFRVASRLLPNQTTTSSMSRRPAYRPVDAPDEATVSATYADAVNAIATVVVDLARKEESRLPRLVGLLGFLPADHFSDALGVVRARLGLAGEEERIALWESMRDLARRHRRFGEAAWALPAQAIGQVEEVAAAFEPKGAATRLRLLFSGPDGSHGDDGEEWQLGAHSALEVRRADAVRSLINDSGLPRVVAFADEVDLPSELGYALMMALDGARDDDVLAQTLPSASGNVRRLSAAFIHSRARQAGWDWVDAVDLSGIDEAGQVHFWTSLPFEPETWERVARAGTGAHDGYWKAVAPRAHRLRDANMVLRELLRVGRAWDALTVAAGLVYMSQPAADSDLLLDALLSTDTSAPAQRKPDAYGLCAVIGALQKDPNVDTDRLGEVEWRFLQVLNGHNGARPTTLWQQLSSNPAMAMSAIRMVYKSKRGDWTEQETPEGLVENAWHLLHHWRTVPGVVGDRLDAAAFDAWFTGLMHLAAESGHEDVTLLVVGKLLAHAPPDIDGFWIDRHLAHLVEQRQHQHMREGMGSEFINSRGVYWADPSGKAEFDLEVKYRRLATASIEAGYPRLAKVLNELGDFYAEEGRRRTSHD